MPWILNHLTQNTQVEPGSQTQEVTQSPHTNLQRCHLHVHLFLRNDKCTHLCECYTIQSCLHHGIWARDLLATRTITLVPLTHRCLQNFTG